MKCIIIFGFFLLLVKNSTAQRVGIGITTPHPSAVLDITSNNKGFLLPLISQSQRIAIANPANGLLVYDTTSQRFYQFQNGAWRYIINSDYWAESTSRKFVYNISDSIGIGTSLPQQKFDVNGDILSRGNISIAAAITANGTASGGVLNANNDITADGIALLTGSLNGNNDLVIDNVGGTLQYKNAGDNKVFYQLSGENMRMGTNSGNSAGTIIFRMNGKNVVLADQASTLVLLKFFGSQELGKMVIGKKINRSYGADPGNNYLTVLYGLVQSDGYSPSMWPQSGSSSRISLGVYEIDTNNADVSAKGAIVVTAAGSVPRICIGRYTSAGKFRVEIFNTAGNHVDNDFYFMINDPLN